jgi:FkbM family methyltransferase
MKQKIKSNIKKIYHWLFLSVFQKELLSLRVKENEGKIVFLGNTFSYHHGQAFYSTYNELFNQSIYKFNLKKANPVIIDCGANMGLSVLYFAKTYPGSKIIAFEPDESVLPYLKQNIKNYQLSNVLLYEKAVWSSNTILSFYTDQGMGGRLELNYNNQVPKQVETIRLKEFLNQEVEFLKIDIEGAEIEVLIDCEDKLSNVNNLFVEYHSFQNSEQQLGELLNLLKRNGFRYHLRQSFSRLRPLVDKNLVCENYDMAINVFAYRN